MKYLKHLVIGGTALALAATVPLAAADLPAGQVDFGPFTPPAKGGEFVEVNLPSSLIAMAVQFVEKQEPQVAQVLGGVQQVHVNVIGLDDENRAELAQRAEKIRQDLQGKGWERIVKARQEGKDVAVFLKTQGKDAVEGLVVVVFDGQERVVFVNIVGSIKPSQLAMLGDRFHIDPLKQLNLPADGK